LNENLLQQIICQMLISGTVPEEIAQFAFVCVPIPKDARESHFHDITHRKSKDIINAHFRLDLAKFLVSTVILA